MESKEITRWQDQTALKRFQMIAPLIGEGLDPAKRAELRRQVAQRNSISERTLRRYEAAYQKAQFEGLKPAGRIAEKIRGPFSGFDKVLEEAGFELRLPSCSSCLAMNPDKVPAGKLSISTSNRNFVGRQGPGARTVLASPLVVAASAITGVITDPRVLVY